MTPPDITATRERLGLTIGQAAYLVGVARRTFSRWESGQRDMPETAARLLLTFELIPAARWLWQDFRCASDLLRRIIQGINRVGP